MASAGAAGGGGAAASQNPPPLTAVEAIGAHAARALDFFSDENDPPYNAAACGGGGGGVGGVGAGAGLRVNVGRFDSGLSASSLGLGASPLSSSGSGFVTPAAQAVVVTGMHWANAFMPSR